MNVYLLRHGIAEERVAGADDAERALTGRGAARTRAAVRGLAALGLAPDRVAASPYLRARQTAELVVLGLRSRRPVELLAALAPDGSPADVVAYLRARRRGTRTVVLVGHEPDLSQLAALWLTGDPGGLGLRLRKAGLVVLSVTEPALARCATLEALLTPRQLRRLGSGARSVSQ